MFIALVEVKIYWTNPSYQEQSEQIHIIEAETEEEAVNKMQFHYDKKTINDYCEYSIRVKSINKIIK